MKCVASQGTLLLLLFPRVTSWGLRKTRVSNFTDTARSNETLESRIQRRQFQERKSTHGGFVFSPLSEICPLSLSVNASTSNTEPADTFGNPTKLLPSPSCAGPAVSVSQSRPPHSPTPDQNRNAENPDLGQLQQLRTSLNPKSQNHKILKPIRCLRRLLGRLLLPLFRAEVWRKILITRTPKLRDPHIGVSSAC